MERICGRHWFVSIGTMLLLLISSGTLVSSHVHPSDTTPASCLVSRTDDAAVVYVGYKSGIIRKWHVERGLVAELRSHNDIIFGLALSPLSMTILL